ncbi:lectin family integral membrane [Neocallimastix lanati (nom. inval.)]|jgi:mannose-binding lectin 2|uniref:Lectin family integral membrane n=1 Tax=Neocallimastix californiae TaxID=1754190 RepID=A0A1Y2D7Z3_9FUNG|nr:lectin family integral membrane [Neocallimastix sp. JGI-2020a]ORY55382.1 lectin family integral membrane [Neocallimastix californiae]|eukprot:ORY55382.1 lectin family integral membrane [Neocallimastix californiae]
MRSSILKLSLSTLALLAGKTFADASYNLKSHSLAPPYITDGLYNRWWDFGGSAVVEINKYVRLTSNQNSQQGWLWSRAPLTAQNWEIEFEFRVGEINGKDHLFGDGFAFFYASERATLGPVFGSKDYFNGLGVFFDTYPNSRHKFSFPRVMPMIGDGKTSYDSEHDGDANNMMLGCSADFRDKKFPTKALIRYKKGEYVEVLLQIKNDQTYQTCFTVQNVTLPTIGYIGFTSNTGDAYDIHDILSVETKGFIIPSKRVRKNQPPQPQNSHHGIHSQYNNQEETGFGFLFWLIVISVILGIGYVVYTKKIANNNRKDNAKLF